MNRFWNVFFFFLWIDEIAVMKCYTLALAQNNAVTLKFIQYQNKKCMRIRKLFIISDHIFAAHFNSPAVF